MIQDIQFVDIHVGDKASMSKTNRLSMISITMLDSLVI